MATSATRSRCCAGSMTGPPLITMSSRAAPSGRVRAAAAAPRPARKARLVSTGRIIVTGGSMRSRSSPPAPIGRACRFAVEHSLVLPVGASIALVWANTSATSYDRFAHALEFPVNDIGMVFFFGLAAKEVVEATCPGGALHPWHRAALPVLAAVGGMVAPAAIFAAFVLAAGQPALVR